MFVLRYLSKVLNRGTLFSNYKIHNLIQPEDYLFNLKKQAKVKEYERQIDQLVYELYGLTEEEIKIVEEEAK